MTRRTADTSRRPARYKAVTTDYRSFYNVPKRGSYVVNRAGAELDWSRGPGSLVYHPGKFMTSTNSLGRTRIPAADGRADTYISTATDPRACTGARWPCRLLKVRGRGAEYLGGTSLPKKRGYTAVEIVDELPAWHVFGPYGRHVEQVLADNDTVWPADLGSGFRNPFWGQRNAATRLVYKHGIVAAHNMMSEYLQSEAAGTIELWSGPGSARYVAALGYLVMPYNRALGIEMTAWHRKHVLGKGGRPFFPRPYPTAKP